MFVEYNPNPLKSQRAGDCAVRAVAKALETDWEKAYTLLASAGFNMGELMNSNIVITAVLREKGFKKAFPPSNCSDCYTCGEFTKNNPKGTFVLFSQNHVCTAVNGNIYDTWNSSDCVILYVLYKEETPIFK